MLHESHSSNKYCITWDNPTSLDDDSIVLHLSDLLDWLGLSSLMILSPSISSSSSLTLSLLLKAWLSSFNNAGLLIEDAKIKMIFSTIYHIFLIPLLVWSPGKMVTFLPRLPVFVTLVKLTELFSSIVFKLCWSALYHLMTLSNSFINCFNQGCCVTSIERRFILIICINHINIQDTLQFLQILISSKTEWI